MFSNWTDAFWSQQQEETNPQCIFQPRSVVEISSSVLLAELFTCPFAIKSGGHAAFAGASSIENGLNIDLSKLNSITLSEDKSVVYVGPGNRWVDVYDYLLPYNLSVIGGRVSDIGLGGLTTGGMCISSHGHVQILTPKQEEYHSSLKSTAGPVTTSSTMKLFSPRAPS